MSSKSSAGMATIHVLESDLIQLQRGRYAVSAADRETEPIERDDTFGERPAHQLSAILRPDC